jgi:hypothetical protein
VLRELLDTYAKGRDFDELAALAARLIERAEAQRLEIVRLRAENRYLRRQIHDRELRLLRRAQADAALMGALFFAMLPTTASGCAAVGISKRRWHWARALLKVARVHDGYGWLVDNVDDYEARLAAAVQRLEADGLWPMRSAVAKQGYAGRRYLSAAKRPQ